MARVWNDLECRVGKLGRVFGLQRCADPVIAVACEKQDGARVGRRVGAYEAQINLCRCVPGLA